jgi:hypothetical protein
MNPTTSEIIYDIFKYIRIVEYLYTDPKRILFENTNIFNITALVPTRKTHEITQKYDVFNITNRCFIISGEIHLTNLFKKSKNKSFKKMIELKEQTFMRTEILKDIYFSINKQFLKYYQRTPSFKVYLENKRCWNQVQFIDSNYIFRDLKNIQYVQWRNPCAKTIFNRLFKKKQSVEAPCKKCIKYDHANDPCQLSLFNMNVNNISMFNDSYKISKQHHRKIYKLIFELNKDMEEINKSINITDPTVRDMTKGKLMIDLFLKNTQKMSMFTDLFWKMVCDDCKQQLLNGLTEKQTQSFQYIACNLTNFIMVFYFLKDTFLTSLHMIDLILLRNFLFTDTEEFTMYQCGEIHKYMITRILVDVLGFKPLELNNPVDYNSDFNEEERNADMDTVNLRRSLIMSDKKRNVYNDKRHEQLRKVHRYIKWSHPSIKSL